jgi:hypothetical protein
MLYCRCNDNLAEERDLTFESPREWDLGVWTCRQPQLPMCRLGDAAGEKTRGERGVEVPLLHKLSTVPYQVFLGIGTL